MKPFAIAFSGGIKSGKSSLSSELAAQLHWPRVSFGDQVRMVGAGTSVEIPTTEPSYRKSVRNWSNPARRSFALAVIAQAGTEWRPGKGLILDGLRHVEIAQVLKPLLAPAVLRIIYVSAPAHVRGAHSSGSRRRRVLGRWDAHSTERQVTDSIPQIADLTIDATLSISVATQQSRGLDYGNGLILLAHSREIPHSGAPPFSASLPRLSVPRIKLAVFFQIAIRSISSNVIVSAVRS